MHITIINDCRDANAAGRQIGRTASLFQCPVAFIGIGNELEAAGNIIDALDATKGRESIILANVAPRHGNAKRHTNGAPFGYFRHGKTLVVSTVGGLGLSLTKKLSLTDSIWVVDTAKTAAIIAEENEWRMNIESIVDSQFRSFDFAPLLTWHLFHGRAVSAKMQPISEIPDIPAAVWWVDNFGNCKTTLLWEEIHTGLIIDGIRIPAYRHLKDVPDGEGAVVCGSSGLGESRFAEIIVQGESAARRFGLSSSSVIGSQLRALRE